MKLIVNQTNATDEAARKELWTSFRSLLQAYLAAASSGMEVPQALLLEPESGQLQIVGLKNTIKLEIAPATGQGYWAVYRNAGPDEGSNALMDEGAFRLHQDAEFDWSGKPGRLAMDQVAEALAMLAFE